MKKQKVSDAVIHRLPRYYRYLDELHNKGVVRISSNSLGQKMDITASQIRQDLSCFGEFGQQGYGYNVAELRSEIGHILGIDSGYRLIVVGAGHLGHALLQNFDFQKVGFQVDTAFDVSPALIGTKIHDVTIRPMEELEHYVEEYHPNVAVLTVPQSVAQPLADRLIALGVKGFWNFTNVELSTQTKGVFFEDIHFVDTLLTLSYRISGRRNSIKGRIILWNETCGSNFHRRSRSYVQSELLLRRLRLLDHHRHHHPVPVLGRQRLRLRQHPE